MSSKVNPDSPFALTIAGLDPSGGAGIIADVRTFTAFGCKAAAAVTSITFQNNSAVFGFVHQTAATVRAQLAPLLREFRIATVKTGMLPTSEIVSEVAHMIREYEPGSLVVDPVMRSTSGHDLIDHEALIAIKSRLLPLAGIVTPNIPEAEKLAGFPIDDESDMRRAAGVIRQFGPRAVLIKGGHLPPPEADGAGRNAENKARREAVDLLDEEGQITVFRNNWIEGADLRGTGCMLSAAIAAGLAKGKILEEAVAAAKEFVAAMIQAAVDRRF